MENLFLIVGLGNPGKAYVQTRHNAGFMAVDTLAKRWQAEWKMDRRFHARLARVQREDRRLLLCQPQTYMNLSGQAVGALTGYYQLPQSRILVLVDDADLPLGMLRLRGSGSSGGHHGLESIEQHLGTRDFARLRLGIGRNSPGERQITDYVLGRFDAAELPLLDQVLTRGADQAECWCQAGLQEAMNEFNGMVESPGTKEN
jgi:peptidyl-tRNA hydrolase, PTH1 family